MLNKFLDKTIILYDGHCPLCHYWIRYAIKMDVNKQLYFAPLQGEFGKLFVVENKLMDFDTVVLSFPNNQHFIYSEAVYELLKYLEIRNFLYYLLMITPQFISNIVYRLVARTRYLIYKRYDNCELPSTEIISRMNL